MNDKIRKYVLPNIPYLFPLWFFLKLGTAYRLAAGGVFGMKLINTMHTIGPVFADFAPGINGFDWLIGIAGAVLLRIIVYFKVKNAKKFRRDVEYGSARWGTQKDIAPFVNPKFQDNVILTVAVLTILWAVLVFLFCWAETLLHIASGLALLVAVALFFYGNTTGVIVFGIIAFLISPVGIPAIAGWLIDKLDDLNDALKDFITT